MNKKSFREELEELGLGVCQLSAYQLDFDPYYYLLLEEGMICVRPEICKLRKVVILAKDSPEYEALMDLVAFQSVLERGDQAMGWMPRSRLPAGTPLSLVVSIADYLAQNGCPL